MTIFALIGCVRKEYGASKIPIFTKNRLMIPLFANSVRKMVAYATSDVAHGKKIIARNNPLNLKFRLFKIEAKISARINMIGT